MKKVMRIFLSALLCVTSFTGYIHIINAEEDTNNVDETEENISDDTSEKTNDTSTQEQKEETTSESEVGDTEETDGVIATLNGLPFSSGTDGHVEYDDKNVPWWVVEDGDVKIKVQNYNPSDGWVAGVSYVVDVTVDFVEENGTGKQIKVTLPEGIKYTKYGIKGEPIDRTPESALTGINNDIIETSINPTPNPYYNSYYGELTYNIVDNGADAVEFSIAVTPDTAVYYKPKVFAGGINVSATKNGSSIGNASVEVNAVGIDPLNPTKISMTATGGSSVSIADGKAT
ncbi:MAG: hypothetical protein ACK5LC_16630, partial [Coprobacillaceae bacterium]